jgi:hypothetical protein
VPRSSMLMSRAYPATSAQKIAARRRWTPSAGFVIGTPDRSKGTWHPPRISSPSLSITGYLLRRSETRASHGHQAGMNAEDVTADCNHLSPHDANQRSAPRCSKPVAIGAPRRQQLRPSRACRVLARRRMRSEPTRHHRRGLCCINREWAQRTQSNGPLRPRDRRAG